MRVRPVRDEDRPRLYEIWVAAVDATHDFLLPDDRTEIGEMVQRDYFPTAPFSVAVDDDGQLLGFIEVEDETVIGALFVDPAYHGQGVGRALVESALPSGVPVTVEVNEANAAARGVYEAWGFRIVDRKETDSSGRPYPLLVLRRD